MWLLALTSWLRIRVSRHEASIIDMENDDDLENSKSPSWKLLRNEIHGYKTMNVPVKTLMR